MQRAALEFRVAPDGALGVFASEPFVAGAIVESCYCIPLKPSSIPGDLLLPYLYDREHGGDEPLLFPLGWGLLYNEVSHDGCEPNLAWEHETCLDDNGVERNYITLRTKFDVGLGDELCCSHRLGGCGQIRDVLQAFFKAISEDPDINLPLLDSTPQDGADLSGGVLATLTFPGVSVKCSPLHGNGVYATKAFAKGDLIEISPNLLMNRWELGMCLIDYRFNLWSSEYEGSMGLLYGVKIALGLGSVFNHKDEPNVGHRPAIAVDCTSAQSYMTCYYALFDIAEGEELCISYGQEWWSSRSENNTSLSEWRLKRGETPTGRPFYDDPAISNMLLGMPPTMIEKLHRTFVDAEDGNTSALKAWMGLCTKAHIRGGINTPLRETGERATHRAAAMGHVAKLKWLVVHGADISAATAPALDLSPAGDMSSSLYPAHYAAMYGQIAALQILHSSGADINCSRPDGATPLDFAEDVGQDEAAAWLLARGGVRGISS